MSHTLNQLTAHKNDNANPHATDLGNLGTGTLAELNSLVTDATLDDSGDSRTPTAHASTHVRGATDVIDGDTVDITFVPTNYTRTTSPTEVTNVLELTAHLAGIDTVLGSITPDGGDLVLNIITTSAANYTVLSDDYTILADSSSNDVTVDLPAASGQDGRILHVKLIDATNTAIIDPNAGELIDGVTTATISVLNDSLKMQCNGTAWYVL